jgi:hypothetical protein
VEQLDTKERLTANVYGEERTQTANENGERKRRTKTANENGERKRRTKTANENGERKTALAVLARRSSFSSLPTVSER